MGSIADTGHRADLVAAHVAVVEDFSRAGARWTATEKTAIGNEVRRAFEYADLPPWHAPSQNGLLDDDLLPPAAVDAVWRITNHPGTLTREWYDDIVSRLPSAEHYIELVSLVAPLNSIDRLAAMIGVEPLAFVDPQLGAPTNAVVDSEVSTHWVPTTDRRGANVAKALTGVPGLDTWSVLGEAQYVAEGALLGDLDWSRGTLDRRQIELLAAKTSLVNECFY